MINQDQFYKLWERFATSEIITELPEEIEKFCEANEITVDYFLEEFI